MFFALSGFLVAGSAFRTKRVLPFLGLRFFRIFPALLVELTLSAIFIGAIFTVLPLRDYYSSPEFFTYFGNLIGRVQMVLPGVTFNGGNRPVNANLWTLPAEFHSYLILAILMAVGLAFTRTVFTIVFALITAGLIIANSFYDFNTDILTGNVNVYYFYTGMFLFLWRDYIPYSIHLFVSCVIISYLMLFSNHTIFLSPLVLTYVTVFIGLADFGTNRATHSGDYSYGIYLYGFPITQVLVPYFRRS